MDIRVLGYVTAIVDTGSFTAAADRCRVAQPSLSRQVAALERELGEVLFIRGRDGAKLTDAGHALMPYAYAALAAIGRARSLFAERSGLLTGTLRVGAVSGLVDTRIPEIVAGLAKAHPQLRIQLVGASGAELIEAVRSHDLDAAVVASEVDPLPESLASLTLLTEQVLAVHLSGTPAGDTAQAFSRADLAGVPLITYSPRSEIGRLLIRELGAPARDAFCLTDDQSLHLALAEQGAGVALTIGTGVVRARRGNLAVRPLNPPIEFRKRLVWHRDAPPSPPLAAMLREVDGGGTKR